jgi:hypothetical protein
VGFKLAADVAQLVEYAFKDFDYLAIMKHVWSPPQIV